MLVDNRRSSFNMRHNRDNDRQKNISQYAVKSF